ncbi:MAG: hypothetical protein ACYDDQ_13720 [Vulcanimicrobiaceae bacterium]
MSDPADTTKLYRRLEDEYEDPDRAAAIERVLVEELAKLGAAADDLDAEHRDALVRNALERVAQERAAEHGIGKDVKLEEDQRSLAEELADGGKVLAWSVRQSAPRAATALAAPLAATGEVLVGELTAVSGTDPSEMDALDAAERAEAAEAGARMRDEIQDRYDRDARAAEIAADREERDRLFLGNDPENEDPERDEYEPEL